MAQRAVGFQLLSPRTLRILWEGRSLGPAGVSWRGIFLLEVRMWQWLKDAGELLVDMLLSLLKTTWRVNEQAQGTSVLDQRT
jgi:hypothetical protein